MLGPGAKLFFERGCDILVVRPARPRPELARAADLRLLRQGRPDRRHRLADEADRAARTSGSGCGASRTARDVHPDRGGPAGPRLRDRRRLVFEHAGHRRRPGRQADRRLGTGVHPGGAGGGRLARRLRSRRGVAGRTRSAASRRRSSSSTPRPTGSRRRSTPRRSTRRPTRPDPADPDPLRGAPRGVVLDGAARCTPSYVDSFLEDFGSTSGAVTGADRPLAAPGATR